MWTGSQSNVHQTFTYNCFCLIKLSRIANSLDGREDFLLMITARVLLANQFGLRRGRLLAAISNQPDIEIVDELEDARDMQKAVARFRPDWVVVTHKESGGLSRQCYEILEEYPQTKIVSIPSCGNSATLCWTSLIMHSHQMEPTQKNLLGALRGKLQFVRALPSRPQLFR